MRVFLLFLSMLISMVGVSRDFEYNGLLYTVTDDFNKTCKTKDGHEYSSNPGNKVSDSLVIPEIVTDGKDSYTVVAIGKYGFYGNENLTSVTIPSSVTSIGKNAFTGCSNIQNFSTHSYNISDIRSSGLTISIPTTLLPNNEEIFVNLSKCNLHTYFTNMLAKQGDSFFSIVTVPYNIKLSNCIYHEDGIALAPYNKQVTAMSSSDSIFAAFFNDKIITDQLSSVDKFTFVPSEHPSCNIFKIYELDGNPEDAAIISVKEAGSLFEKISFDKFESIELIKIIGNINGTDILTINRMTALKYVDLSDANIVSGGYAYNDNLQTENDIIGSYFFYGINPETVILPKTLKTIGENAFNYKSSLKIVCFNNELETIGDGAFSGCINLKYVTLPNSLKSLGNWSFCDCSGLFQVDFGNSIATINSRSFKRCTSLTSVSFPPSISKIGFDAFEGCTGLQSVQIEDLESWCSIDFGDFSNPLYYARKLYLGDIEAKNIIIPATITEIKDYAFINCNLSYITFPEGLSSIGTKAFKGSGLKEVILPSSLMNINRGAFENCDLIQQVITLNPLPPTIDSSSFDETVESTATLYVPQGSFKSYWLNPIWSEFKKISDEQATNIENITEGEDPITEIYDLRGNLVFKGMSTDAALSKGLYIKKQGYTVDKILIQ